jgi:predicted transcriptional regulator
MEPKKHIMSVELRDDQKRAIKIIADSDDRSSGYVIRRAIDEYIKRDERTK